MHTKLCKRVLAAAAAAISFNILTAGLPTAGASPGPDKLSRPSYGAALSANVPLDSYVYDYINKLDGLGYLTAMQTGTKPYSRMQVAGWVAQMTADLAKRPVMPAYARQMLTELQTELGPELAILSGAKPQTEFSLKEMSFGEVYYHGRTLQQHHTKSTYQPLNINNNGYKYGDSANEIVNFRAEGRLSDHLIASVTPRLSYDDTQAARFTLDSGYVKTHINNMAIQIGKDADWWGQGTRGSMLWTNNAEPQIAIKLSNIQPQGMHGFLKFLGKSNYVISYSVLETDRSDVRYPSFLGIRKDFTPTENFTFALAQASIIGGEGHMLTGGNYYDWAWGKNNDADAGEPDKWDSIAGVDFRLRLPKWNNIQLYGDFYGEDRHRHIIPYPYKIGKMMGIYIPRLTPSGDWDARFEHHETSRYWYVHGLYTDGWIYEGNIIGNAIGYNADSYYAQFTKYINGSQISFNFERLKMDNNSATQQKVTSYWIDWKTRLEKDLSLKSSVGVAKTEDQNRSSRNYLFSAMITKNF